MTAAEFQAQHAKKGKVKLDTTPPPSVQPRVSKAAKTALPPPTMEQQLETTEIMDAVACFSMGKNFKFVHYEHNRITATHQSGATVTITFK